MNYHNIYNNIIQKRKNQPIVDGYFEVHHILPKSVGGSDKKENLVSLTAKEHFICHLLLTKMYPIGSVEYKKMLFAFHMIQVCRTENQKRYITSKKYDKIKKQFCKLQSEAQSGSKNSQYGKRSYYNKLTLQNKKFREPPSDDWILGFYSEKRIKKFEAKKQHKLESEKIKIERFKRNKQKADEWYEIYDKFGFENFKTKTGYDKSKQNLVKFFSNYSSIYKPQNGKRRGIK